MNELHQMCGRTQIALKATLLAVLSKQRPQSGIRTGNVNFHFFKSDNREVRVRVAVAREIETRVKPKLK